MVLHVLLDFGVLSDESSSLVQGLVLAVEVDVNAEELGLEHVHDREGHDVGEIDLVGAFLRSDEAVEGFQLRRQVLSAAFLDPFGLLVLRQVESTHHGLPEVLSAEENRGHAHALSRVSREKFGEGGSIQGESMGLSVELAVDLEHRGLAGGAEGLVLRTPFVAGESDVLEFDAANGKEKTNQLTAAREVEVVQLRNSHRVFGFRLDEVSFISKDEKILKSIYHYHTNLLSTALLSSPPLDV